MRRRNKAALLGVAAGALALYVRRRLRRRAAARAPRGGARPAGEQGVRGGGAKNAPTPGVLILVRHGATAWHEQKIFTGWADVNINARGRREMERAARVLLESGHTVDVAYTSKLKRAIRSTWILLQELDQVYRPVFKTWRLNERAYGALTGLREDRCKAAVGADTWWRWRMSLRARPPPLSADHPLAPHRERKYADVPRAELPTSESLQDCLERALPLWHERVAPDLRAGRNVLVVAHGNSLRGLVKAIDDVDPIEIERVRFAHGVPMVYKFAHCRAAPKGGAAGAAGGARVSAAEEVGLRPLPQPKAVKPLSGECLEGKDAMPSRPSHTELLERSDSEASLAGLADDPADGADEATRELSAERAVAAIVRAEVQALEHAAATQVDVMTYDDGVTITETPRVRARRWRRPRPSADTGPRQAAVDRARQLVIIRHGKTEHNKLGLFTGWQDAQLAAEGRLEAKAAGELLARHGFAFDVCYTSWLGRAMETAWICLGMLDQLWLPIVKDWRLNERMYGALTGLSKKMIKQRHGAKQFLAWRRSFATRPPPVSPFSPLYPGNDERYVKYVHDQLPTSWTQSLIRSLAHGRLERHPALPQTESLRDCMERTIPFFRDVIVPDALDRGKTVLIASSENAIRGLLMHLCEIPTDRIAELEIPTGVPIVFDFEARCVKLLDDGRAPSPLERYDFGPAGEHLFLDATDDGDGGLVPLPDDDEAAPGAYQ